MQQFVFDSVIADIMTLNYIGFEEIWQRTCARLEVLRFVPNSYVRTLIL